MWSKSVKAKEWANYSNILVLGVKLSHCLTHWQLNHHTVLGFLVLTWDLCTDHPIHPYGNPDNPQVVWGWTIRDKFYGDINRITMGQPFRALEIREATTLNIESCCFNLRPLHWSTNPRLWKSWQPLSCMNDELSFDIISCDPVPVTSCNMFMFPVYSKFQNWFICLTHICNLREGLSYILRYNQSLCIHVSVITNLYSPRHP